MPSLHLLMFFTLLLPCALGFWLLRRGLAVEFWSVDPSSAIIEEYKRYRERLQRFLLILGLGVTLLTLATGALRKALIAVGAASADTFPVNFVLIYGGYFTLLLAILYLPAYSALLEAGRRVRDAYCPFPERTPPIGIKHWPSARPWRKPCCSPIPSSRICRPGSPSWRHC